MVKATPMDLGKPTDTAQRMELKFIKPENHNLIDFIDYNRDIDPKHVASLEPSVRKFGMLGPVLMVQNGNRLSVLDWQHRVVACMNLGIEIPYIVLNHLSTEQIPQAIAILNTTGKKWKLNDYFCLYQKMNVPAYVKLAKLMEKTGLSMKLLLHLHTNDPLKSYILGDKREWKTFKNGVWSSDALNLDYFNSFRANLYRVINQFKSDTFTKTTAFADSLAHLILHPKYDPEQMEANIAHNKIAFEDISSHSDFFDTFLLTYNRTRANRLSFDYQLAIDGTICTSEKESRKIRKLYVSVEQFAEMSPFSDNYARATMSKQPNKGEGDLIYKRKKYWRLNTALKCVQKQIDAMG